jgi:diguanylate cyclase (GGDEF)-like protein
LRRRITPLLIAALAALPLVIVVVAGVTGSRNLQEVQLEYMRTVLNTVATDVAELTAEYLEPTEHLLEVGAALSERGLVDFRNREIAEVYLLESLASNPRVDGVYWAAEDGSFLYVHRDDSYELDGFRTKWIDGTDPEAGAILVHRSADGGVINETEDPSDRFDPRTRPWYEAATTATGVAWTDAYLFHTAREPGLSAAITIATGPSVGVLGADIPTDALGDFISSDKPVTISARILVVGNGELIAHSRPEVLGLASGAAPPPIEDLTDAPSRIAGLTAGGGDGWTQLLIEDEVYHSSSAKVPINDWVVVAVAPESDFTARFAGLQRSNLMTLAAIAAGALVLAVPLTRLTLRDVGSLRNEAQSDALTRLLNRRSFEARGERMLDAAARRRRSTGAIMVDIDHFKRLNDSYGHHAGDEILRAVAGRVRHAVPKSDIVGRLGGDELAVIVENADLVATRAVATRIHRAVTETPISTPRGPVYVTVSLGAASTDGLEEMTLDHLLKSADRALYASKRAGRNRVTAVAGELLPR